MIAMQRTVLTLLFESITLAALGATEYHYQSSLPSSAPCQDGRYDLTFKVSGKPPLSSEQVLTNLQEVISNGLITAQLNLPKQLTAGGVYSLDIAWRPGPTNGFSTVVTNQEVVVDQAGNIRTVTHTPWGPLDKIRRGTVVDAIFYLIGIICMVVYTVEQFNTPPTNRSSTTPMRYKTALLAYVTFGLTVYLLLTSFPELLAVVMRMELKDLPAWVNGLATPLFVALLLTTFLPKIELLNSADVRVRKKLWKMAAIPSEAEDLSGDLQSSDFNPPDDVKRNVEGSLQGKGFEQQDFTWQANGKVRSEFTRIAVLMAALRRWQAERNFRVFFRYYRCEKEELEHRYKSLCAQAGGYFSLVRSSSTTTQADLEHLEKECQESCEKLSNDLFSFVSRALLFSEASEEERYKRALEFGFSLKGKPQSLPFHQLMFLFLVISVIVMVALVLSQEFLQAAGTRPRIGIGQLLDKAAMISAIYCLSVVCALYPKGKSARARATGPDWIKDGAWGYYLGSAVVAAIASVLFSAAWQFAFSLGSSAKFVESLTQKYPYGLVSFVTTLITTCCADFDIFSKQPARADTATPFARSLYSARWEAALQIVAGLITAWLVNVWLKQTLIGQQPPPALALLLVFAIVGGLIGYFVPSWFRQAQAERAFHLQRATASKKSEALAQPETSKTGNGSAALALQSGTGGLVARDPR